MTTSESTEPAERDRRRLALVIVVALAAAVIGTVAFVLVRSDDTNTRISARDAAATAQLRSECERWASTRASGDGPTGSTWCGEMVAWMRSQMAGGDRTGSMMWGSPQAVRRACLDAMDADEDLGARMDWCEEMVDWIAAGRGDWDHGVMNPTGMGPP
jgi:hypothetical protein